MKYVAAYQCTECQRHYSADTPMNLCPDDGRPVQMRLDVEAIKRDFPNNRWYRPDVASMWRFGPLLPFDIGTQPDNICSLGEGYTPVRDVPEDIHAVPGIEVLIKDEGQPYPGYGANPTGSFKDRGMAMVTTMARHYGLQRLVVPTQGNAGDSLSEYGHAYGLDVAVIMPDDTPMPILGKVAAYSQLYDGISLALVKGTIREAGARMKAEYVPAGYFNCATFQEPGWRIEGKKLWGLSWQNPGRDVSPPGNYLM